MLETHSSEGKPTTGRVRGSATSSLHCCITLAFMSLFLKSVVFMSRPWRHWMVGFLDNGVNPPPSFPSSPLPLHLNCPSDSAGRAPHAHPTLVQLEGPRHLASSVAIFLGISLEDFEVTDWARSSPRKEWRIMVRRRAQLRL